VALSSQSAVAIHALTFLAHWTEDLQSSEWIAESLESNPVLVRRVLGRLRARRLVASVEGRGGGWRLARPAGEITLYDAYAAVEDGRVLSLHAHPPSAECVIGRHIQSLLDAEFAAAEQAMHNRLARTSIADMLRHVLMHERELGPPRPS
jgi:Rrf2 family protein